MHATSEPAELSSVLPPEHRSDSTITTLYRAALGPVHLSRYLPVFARFDEAGRTTTGWNWAASLCTLNWMVFRQLWGPALVYVAAAEGLALLVFGVGRPLLHWPQAVEWGVVAAFFLLGCTVPGLYGNALLHADTHKKITLALTATHTLNEACALLARQASSRKRLAWLAAGNLALALAAAGAYLAMPSTDPPVAVAATPVAQVRAAPPDPPEQLLQAAALPTLPVASAPAALESRAATDAATQALSAAAEAAAIPTPAAAPEPAQKSAEPAAEPAALPPPLAAPPERAPRPAAPAKRSPPSQAKALPAVGTAPGYYINVGLFAEEANARKAQAQLLNEGLPAFRQEIVTGKKRRLRVRVGPFSKRADANAAARTIRSMALEAAVIKRPP